MKIISKSIFDEKTKGIIKTITTVVFDDEKCYLSKDDGFFYDYDMIQVYENYIDYSTKITYYFKEIPIKEEVYAGFIKAKEKIRKIIWS